MSCLSLSLSFFDLFESVPVPVSVSVSVSVSFSVSVSPSVSLLNPGPSYLNEVLL